MGNFILILNFYFPVSILGYYKKLKNKWFYKIWRLQQCPNTSIHDKTLYVR